jgi:hypothetical protein
MFKGTTFVSLYLWYNFGSFGVSLVLGTTRECDPRGFVGVFPTCTKGNEI